ncbi:MCM2/3/5 family-domain-containing protein [Gorgonomyces haynaldii]|nr:MCM2/3/5 family-domain-containing protein [Gorgonomyces haynaldii]
MLSGEEQKTVIAHDLLQLCRPRLIEILHSQSPKESLLVNMVDLNLINNYHDFRIINQPGYLDIMDQAVIECLEMLQLEHGGSVKPVRTRIEHIPHCHLKLNRVPKCDHLNSLIVFSGVVIRTGMVQLLNQSSSWECLLCQRINTLPTRMEFHHKPEKPSKCWMDGCKSNKFKPIETEQAPRDYQEIRVQERMSGLEMGTVPQSITVILEDDLVDLVKSGDDVHITGIVQARTRNLKQGQRCELELVIVGNYIKINNQQFSVVKDLRQEFLDFWSRFKDEPIRGRDRIIKSFCPQVKAMALVKLAVMLILIGGVQRRQGHTVRGDAHLLLVGDPGTAKSQFLRFACQVCPRSILTTGIGTTTAGLTCTAIKDQGEWQLEAGALVLADRGICCIDEFSSIREQDKTSIHEAMEQQSISVAKAGLVCKLNTRCAILAATNPKGKYDEEQGLEINIALASPLLSRFDLILILVDAQNKDWDEMVSSYILDQQVTPQQLDVWDIPTLQAYIQFCKTFEPDMSPEAEKVLKTYYQQQRLKDLRNQARTTIRLLESLVRLSQAHARLMLREIVTVQDALAAVQLMETSTFTGSFDGVESALYSDFSKTPDLDQNRKDLGLLESMQLESLHIPYRPVEHKSQEHVILPSPQKSLLSISQQFSQPPSQALSSFRSPSFEMNNTVLPSIDGTPGTWVECRCLMIFSLT